MPRLILIVVSCLSLLLLAACGGGGNERVQCDLDVENLTGDWISLKGGGTGADVPDKYARVRFYIEDGKKKAIYTAGQVAPGNPATNKYDYDYIEKTQLGDVLYSINMFPNKSKQRIERLKKDNRRLDVKFEGRIYVKVDPKRCALVVSDMYVTYVKGEETIDSNPAGTRTYLRANPDEPELSFVHCDEPRQLLPFAEATLDWSRSPRPVDPKSGIFAGEPVYFHYVEKAFEGSKSEVNEKLKEVGVLPTEGETYEYELWTRDMRVDGADKIKIEVAEDGRVGWAAEHTFKKSSADGVFVEMHRYKTDAAGKRTRLGNACTVVWPEPARSDEEKAEAEAGGGKK